MGSQINSQRFTGFVLLTALIVAVAGAAQAVVFEISTKNRSWCCDAVFIAGVPQNNAGYHTVTATATQGSKGAPFTLNMGHAVRFYSMFFAADLPPVSLKTNFGTQSLFNEAGMLAKNGGNVAAFSFCPKYVGLPIPGAGCANPALATPTSEGFNGQAKVTPGASKFGGTMRILAPPGGVASKFFVYRFLGGPNMSQLPAALIYGGFDFAPIGAMTPGYAVTQPQPAMVGVPPNFNSASFPNQKLWQAGAGPFTTGMVTLKITMQAGLPVRSVMLAGYDNRTAGGKGNVQLVSGVLANGYDGGSPGGTPIGNRMTISFIPEPSASLGFAAGAFGLFLAGLGRARRGSSENE